MKNPGSKLLLAIVLVWSILYKPGTILVREGGKELLIAELKKGSNSLLLTVPAVKSDRKIIFTTTINGGKAENSKFTLTPPRKWDLFVVEHSHTDIGYTRLQSKILA